MTISLPLVASGTIHIMIGLDPPTLKVLTDLTAAIAAERMTPDQLATLAKLTTQIDAIDPHPGASNVPNQ